MSTKQELRAIIDDLRDRLHVLRTERNTLRDELTAVRTERDAVIAALTELRQSDEPTPAPRPFRVGDRVRVAEGATYRQGDRAWPAAIAGCGGVVTDAAGSSANITVAPAKSGAWVSPEFCTLIESTPEPVSLILADGTRITFDAVVTR